MKIVAICGSLRKASSNRTLLEACGFPILELRLPLFEPDLDVEGAAAPPAVAEFRAALGEAHAVVVSSPEYAHGVPGALKNALDWVVSSNQFENKPVLLLNASPVGGEFAQAQLRETLKTMGARVLPDVRVMRRKGEHDPEALRAALDALARAVVDGAA